MPASFPGTSVVRVVERRAEALIAPSDGTHDPVVEISMYHPLHERVFELRYKVVQEGGFLGDLEETLAGRLEEVGTQACAQYVHGGVVRVEDLCRGEDVSTTQYAPTGGLARHHNPARRPPNCTQICMELGTDAPASLELGGCGEGGCGTKVTGYMTIQN